VWCDARDLAARPVPPDQESSMERYAGNAVMGSKPAAGQPRAHACVAASAPASIHRPWQVASLATTPMFGDVADLTRHRRPPERT
jgi:hypothetical protein